MERRFWLLSLFKIRRENPFTKAVNTSSGLHADVHGAATFIGAIARPLAAFCLIFAVYTGNLWAATITAASCSQADVSTAVNNAANGDTVLVPPGACTWTTQLTITNKSISLIGAGIGNTIITDGVDKSQANPNRNMLVWTTQDTGLTRLSGFTVLDNGSSDGGYNVGILIFKGWSHRFRMDHVRIVPTATTAVFFFDGIYGVVDHNLFDISAAHGFAHYTFHASLIPGTWNADVSWSTPDTFGTANALFFEDNLYLNDQSHYFYYYAIDGWAGQRAVYRYNTFVAAILDSHGTESSGRRRGIRQWEIYNNNWTWDLKGNAYEALQDLRGGVGISFNNTATITNGTTVQLHLKNLRDGESDPPWGTCNGTSAWDGNTAGQSGYPCMDQIGVGMGALLSSPTGDWDQNPTPVGYSNVPDPTYAWNNTINGIASPAVSGSAHIVEGRDFFNAVKPGYIPYTYPHPLVSGSASTGAPPAPPQNLTVK